MRPARTASGLGSSNVKMASTATNLTTPSMGAAPAAAEALEAAAVVAAAEPAPEPAPPPAPAVPPVPSVLVETAFLISATREGRTA